MCHFYWKNNNQIMSQFCTCHDSSAVMTCANLWHDLIIRIKIKAKIFFARYELWAHLLFVRRVPKVNSYMLYWTHVSAYLFCPTVFIQWFISGSGWVQNGILWLGNVFTVMVTEKNMKNICIFSCFFILRCFNTSLKTKSQLYLHIATSWSSKMLTPLAGTFLLPDTW